MTQSDVASTRSAPSVWRITAPCGGGTGSYLLSRNTFVKNEFRPGTDWLISTLLEWNLQQAGLGISRLGRSSWQYTEKLDVRPGYTTRMIAQYRRFSQDQGFDRTTNSHEPSLWVEQRWTPDFLTTAQALYRVTGTEDRTTSGKLHDWEGMLDFVLRKDQWIGIRHVEFTQDFSGSRQSQNGTPVQRNYRLGATSSLDLYPFSSLIVRLRFDYTTFVDQVFDTGSYSTVDYTLKLSLQL